MSRPEFLKGRGGVCVCVGGGGALRVSYKRNDRFRAWLLIHRALENHYNAMLISDIICYLC